MAWYLRRPARSRTHNCTSAPLNRGNCGSTPSAWVFSTNFEAQVQNSSFSQCRRRVSWKIGGMIEWYNRVAAGDSSPERPVTQCVCNRAAPGPFLPRRSAPNCRAGKGWQDPCPAITGAAPSACAPEGRPSSAGTWRWPPRRNADFPYRTNRHNPRRQPLLSVGSRKGEARRPCRRNFPGVNRLPVHGACDSPQPGYGVAPSRR